MCSCFMSLSGPVMSLWSCFTCLCGHFVSLCGRCVPLCSCFGPLCLCQVIQFTMSGVQGSNQNNPIWVKYSFNISAVIASQSLEELKSLQPPWHKEFVHHINTFWKVDFSRLMFKLLCPESEADCKSKTQTTNCHLFFMCVKCFQMFKGEKYFVLLHCF